MNFILVGLGEVKISGQREDVLFCPGIGSCVAVCAYDFSCGLAGLFHCVLPESNGNSSSHKYADSGIEVLLKEIQKAGAAACNVKARVVGGASVLSNNSDLDIGKKNVDAVLKHLEKFSVPVVGRDTGGNLSRTVRFYVYNGQVAVSSVSGKEKII